MAAVHEFQDLQAAEYGTFVAVEPIFIDGVRAFNRGDAVPTGHVDRKVVGEHQVARRTTKAAQAVTGEG